MKNRLKELRKTRSWSQSDLARALQVSRQAVNGFESGKFTPSLEMAFKIAQLFNVAIEAIFLYQEKNTMQTLVENLTQWLPKEEKFTVKAIAAIEYAQQQAALSSPQQVEPKHLLLGLLYDDTTTAARLLRSKGLTISLEKPEVKPDAPKIKKFSPECKYVLELALQIVKLKQKKYIETEHLLLGLIQLIQLGNNDLVDLLQQYEVDINSLVTELTKVV